MKKFVLAEETKKVILKCIEKKLAFKCKVNEVESKLVQEFMFANGVVWADGTDIIQSTDEGNLTFSNYGDSSLYYTSDYICSNKPEIEIKLVEVEVTKEEVKVALGKGKVFFDNKDDMQTLYSTDEEKLNAILRGEVLTLAHVEGQLYKLIDGKVYTKTSGAGWEVHTTNLLQIGPLKQYLEKKQKIAKADGYNTDSEKMQALVEGKTLTTDGFLYKLIDGKLQTKAKTESKWLDYIGNVFELDKLEEFKVEPWYAKVSIEKPRLCWVWQETVGYKTIRLVENTTINGSFVGEDNSLWTDAEPMTEEEVKQYLG